MFYFDNFKMGQPHNNCAGDDILAVPGEGAIEACNYFRRAFDFCEANLFCQLFLKLDGASVRNVPFVQVFCFHIRFYFSFNCGIYKDFACKNPLQC